MDFYSGQDLLDLCQKEKISISSAMKQREITMGSLSAEEIGAKVTGFHRFVVIECGYINREIILLELIINFSRI